MNNELLDKKLKQSGRVSTYLAISEGIFLALVVIAFVLEHPQQFGFIIAGSLAIGFFWLFIQQKIIKSTYKLMLDYKFDDLQKNVKKSSDNLLENLSKESTELIDDKEFDITKVKDKKDSELV